MSTGAVYGLPRVGCTELSTLWCLGESDPLLDSQISACVTAMMVKAQGGLPRARPAAKQVPCRFPLTLTLWGISIPIL